jgi:tRNA dimethylallyltransferase
MTASERQETPVTAILGPTASGKSALAHEVARRSDAILLAVDSMTVHRGMAIGTAKPTAAERAEVDYRGLDVIEPTETFAVARWLEVADATLAEAKEAGRPVVAVGGTPLYWQALFRGLFDGPAADADFRTTLADVPDDELLSRLAAVDPDAAARLHVNDRKRLVRALEVYTLSGRTITELQRQWDAGPDRVRSVRFGLHWPRPELNRRINARSRAMLEAGWLDEVHKLLDTHGNLSATAGEAAGYALLTQVVRGERTLADAAEQIKIRTRQLAKRQMTWFRRFENVTWLPGDGDFETHVARVVRSVTGPGEAA